MKDIPTSPRIALMKRNRKILRLRLSILFSILFVSIVGSVAYFSAHPRFTIYTIRITGNSIIDENELQAKVKETISGRYWRLFSKSNFLIYPQKSIYNKLRKDFPRIEELSIGREGMHTIYVNVKERAGAYLYCGVVVPLNKEEIGEDCYFINNDGYIFDKAPYFSGDVYFKYYTKTEGDPTKPLDSQMIPVDRFHELMRFIDSISTLGFNPTHLVIDDKGIYSLYLKSKGEFSNPRIIFKEDNDLVVILDNLSSAMKEKEFANEINSKYDTLSYIDLRFKNKVLYKFQ